MLSNERGRIDNAKNPTVKNEDTFKYQDERRFEYSQRMDDWSALTPTTHARNREREKKKIQCCSTHTHTLQLYF